MGTERSLVSQILKHNNNVKSDHELIDLVDKLDPAALTQVIAIVEQMRLASEQDLTRITGESTKADSDYADAVNKHNAAIVAKTQGDADAQTALDDGKAAADQVRDDGISNLESTHTVTVGGLQTTYNDVTANLQSAVDVASLVKDEAKKVKDEANAVLAQEKGRLDNEISSLTQVLDLLNGIAPPTAAPTAKPGCVTTGGNVPEGTPCVFPFVYHGVLTDSTYTECTDYDNSGVLWCSTEPEYNNGVKNWGNCVCP